MTNRERKVRDRWETGEVIPLPSILFDHSLSDEALQDRWVAEAERKVKELRAALADAEAFLADAKRAQARYQQQPEAKQQPARRPAQVEALLTRRTPAQVAQLLEVASAQGHELADVEGEWRALPPPKS